MNVTIIQNNIIWEDKSANFTQIERLLNEQALNTDLIVLPEMFATGFTMNTALGERMNGLTVSWLQTMAQKFNAAMAGSFIHEDKARGCFQNRFLMALPNGDLHFYDKRHLFGLAGEHLHFAQGETLTTIDWRGWRICPMICYDLRFPVWSRNNNKLNYDILLYIANWPNARAKHWHYLNLARAIENQSFVVGVNRVGKDAKGLQYDGGSLGITPLGEIIYRADDSESLQTISLDKNILTQTRQKLPFLKDADNFNII